MSDSHRYYHHYKMKLKVSCTIMHTSRCQFYYSSYNKSSESACLWIHAWMFPTIYILKKIFIHFQNSATRNSDVFLKALLLRLFCLLLTWWHLWLSHRNTLYIHHSPHSVNNVIQTNSLVHISEKSFHHVFISEVHLLDFNPELTNKTILLFFFPLHGMDDKKMKQAFA